MPQFGWILKFKMAEFFLELFSEEIPAGLQKNLREKLFLNFIDLFEKNFLNPSKRLSRKFF